MAWPAETFGQPELRGGIKRTPEEMLTCARRELFKIRWGVIDKTTRADAWAYAGEGLALRGAWHPLRFERSAGPILVNAAVTSGRVMVALYAVSAAACVAVWLA